MAAALGEGAHAALHLPALVLQQVDVAQAADALAEGDVVVVDERQSGSSRTGLRGDGLGQLAQRQHDVGEAVLDHGARHAVDGAALGGLAEDAPAGGAHGAGALGAVAAHAGQDDEQRALAPAGGDVGDREVGARAQAADRGLVGQPRLARAVEAKVGAAGGDERGAGLELVAEGGLADVQGDMRSRRAASEPVKPAGMCWTIRVPSPRRAGSAGSSWASARGPPVEAAMTTARGAPVAGTAPRGAGAAWPLAVAVADERRGGRLGDGLAQALGEVLGEGVEGLADRRLGHEVEGALGQRVDRAGAVGGREGADDDDRHVGRAVLLQGAQDAEAVEAGHGEVEGHGVGPRGAALRERLVAVAGGAHHLEAGSTERAAEDGAHERRVVGDDDAGGGGHRWLGGDLGAEAEEPGWAEQHDQAVVELDDGVDRGLVGGREALELVGVDGDDLVDVVDDDPGELRRGLDDDDLLLGDVLAAARSRGATRGRRRGRSCRAG